MMAGLDRAMALLAFLTLAGFLAVIIFSVKQVALIIVCSLGLALATYDFWQQLFSRR